MTSLSKGWRALAKTMVPSDFVLPDPPRTPRFRLEPMGEEHSDGDYDAWSQSIEHVLATPGFVGWEWPPPHGMTRDENREAVLRHRRHSDARVGFTYSVVENGSGTVIGCAYIYPDRRAVKDCELRTWVGRDWAELDADVHHVTLAWLEEQWPFGSVRSFARD